MMVLMLVLPACNLQRQTEIPASTPTPDLPESAPPVGSTFKTPGGLGLPPAICGSKSAGVRLGLPMFNTQAPSPGPFQVAGPMRASEANAGFRVATVTVTVRSPAGS
jgi:hypothetical protein